MATFLILWVVFAIAVGFLAKQRGRGMVTWAIISVIVSPLLGFAILMMKQDLALLEAIDTVTHDMELTHVKCVHCHEYVLPEASVCPYCRGAITPQPEFVKQRLAEKLAETEEIQAGKQGNMVIGIGIVAGISVIAWLSTFLK
ncbi:MAG TPA: zinc ribbon domain-containing protein [Burkholderiaceae bacterium]|nr:zinc ribbon domain-containing protein [Burkholderiaceae bacterium]